MKITVIAAMDRNQGIGFRGDIPWYLPEELKHFNETVKNHILICGKKTFAGLPAKYHTKNTVVITRKDYIINGTKANSLFEAISKAKALAEAQNMPSELFIIGGSQIYKEAVLLADELILSYVSGNYTTDVKFPEVQYSRWTVKKVKTMKDHRTIWWIRR